MTSILLSTGVAGGGGVSDHARHAQRNRNPPTLGAKVQHDPAKRTVDTDFYSEQ